MTFFLSCKDVYIYIYVDTDMSISCFIKTYLKERTQNTFPFATPKVQARMNIFIETQASQVHFHFISLCIQ